MEPESRQEARSIETREIAEGDGADGHKPDKALEGVLDMNNMVEVAGKVVRNGEAAGTDRRFLTAVMAFSQDEAHYLSNKPGEKVLRGGV